MPGLSACGALPIRPAAILDWAAELRSLSNRPFQLNLWVPDPPPPRDPAGEAGPLPFAVLLQSADVPGLR